MKFAYNFHLSSFLALTVNEICFLFLRQVFRMLKPSTVTFPSGTSRKSPIWSKVSRNTYIWECFEHAIVIGDLLSAKDVMQRHAWEWVGRRGWWHTLRRGNSSWLWAELTFFSTTVLCQGSSAFFYCVDCEWKLPSFFATAFYQVSVFNSDISKWDTSKVTTMENCKSLRIIENDLTWREHAIAIGGFSRGLGWWRGCDAKACVRVNRDGRRGWWNMLRRGDSSWLWMNFAFFSCVDCERNLLSFLATVFYGGYGTAFNGDISKWDVSKVTNINSSKSIRIFENDLMRTCYCDWRV